MNCLSMDVQRQVRFSACLQTTEQNRDKPPEKLLSAPARVPGRRVAPAQTATCAAEPLPALTVSLFSVSCPGERPSAALRTDELFTQR
jgi:hypothetical protein